MRPYLITLVGGIVLIAALLIASANMSPLPGLMGPYSGLYSAVANIWPRVTGIYHKGRADRAEAKNEALTAQNAALSKQLAQAQATERVVTKYIDRVKVVQGRTQTIIKEVPVYVPADSPDLPAGWRVLHDAAATGADLPDPARIADAAAVPAQDAAATVADNYGTCHATEAQLTALQEWIRAQQAIK